MEHFSQEQKAKKAADRKAKIASDAEMRDLRTVLSTREGRRVFWRLLGHTKVFRSIYEQSARIHYNAGQQDVGHYLLEKIELADLNAFFLMKREAVQDMERSAENSDSENQNQEGD